MSPHHARPAVCTVSFHHPTEAKQTSKQPGNQHQQQRQSWKEHGPHTQPIPRDEALYRQTGVAAASRWRRESMSGGLSPPPALSMSPLCPRSPPRPPRAAPKRGEAGTLLHPSGYMAKHTENGGRGSRTQGVRVWNRHGTVMYGRLRHGQWDQETVIRKGVQVDQKSWIKRKGFRAFVSTYLELEN